MRRKPHSGKNPPQLPKMNRRVKEVPPESPVTKCPINAAQSAMGPMDADGFVDLKRAGRGGNQQPQVNLAGGLPKADFELGKSQLQPSQYQVVQPHLQNQYGLQPVPQGEIKVFNKSQLLQAMYKLQQQQPRQQQQLERASPCQHLPDTF
ncbi:uncharacterized protein LOC128208106 [Mya arenaria]|uniref:uncharacterized protein LOC128208106 n=1 Tax=Mya arenaria TaxID=6604 RepID=UPI0022E5CDE9|nr:uncharacterized protein LOC128208106 [Mya arenaria]